MTLIMGVLNVTPDSFSDGGLWVDPERAVEHGLSMVSDGAEIIDVGGESTRPGAQRVSVAEEISRVIPVVERLVDAGVTVSVDTMHSDTAREACAVGARFVNDVSGGMADSKMFDVVARSGVELIIQHWRGHSAVMDSLAHYDDVVAEVVQETISRRDAAQRAGIAPELIVLDPGLGFAKEAKHNWQLLRALDRWQATGHRVLIGASRKRFLAEAVDRDVATAAISAWCAAHQIWAVRTHEVRMQRDAIMVGRKLGRGGQSEVMLG